MPNYFLIAIYLLSIFSIFIVPLYINIKRDRVVALSLLPIVLVATTVSLVMLISSFFDGTPLINAITFSIFVFFEFIIFGYLMMLPILILIAFIIEYLRVNYQYSPIKLSLLGAISGAIIVSITFMKWEFILIAFISGAISVLVQYYFTEYKNKSY